VSAVPLLFFTVPADDVGADIVRELGMLCVEHSPLAPRKVYRSIRVKPRYDTEHEKGWEKHINNVAAPFRTVEAPTVDSATGRITTVNGEILDDVDVSPVPAHLAQPVQLTTYR